MFAYLNGYFYLYKDSNDNIIFINSLLFLYLNKLEFVIYNIKQDDKSSSKYQYKYLL